MEEPHFCTKCYQKEFREMATHGRLKVNTEWLVRPNPKTGVVERILVNNEYLCDNCYWKVQHHSHIGLYSNIEFAKSVLAENPKNKEKIQALPWMKNVEL
jgi:hypothetical protein